MDSQIEEKKLRILIVDIAPLGRELLKRILVNAGFECAEAASAEEALSILDREHYSVVITGFVLEGDDGADLCQAIRERKYPRYIYTIILSANNEAKNVRRGLESGADEFLAKPANEPIILARLRVAERIIDLEEKLKLIELRSEDLLNKDPLTAVYNRYRIQKDLPREMSRALRYGESLSIILCDIDHFKKVNDTHGHQAGDKALKEIANRLRVGCREEIDWVARYGGEEFMIVLPETNLEGARTLAERMRKSIFNEPVTIEGGHDPISVSMSFGIAEYQKFEGSAETQESFIERADSSLYKAKKGGRNRVVSDQSIHSIFVEKPGGPS